MLEWPACDRGNRRCCRRGRGGREFLQKGVRFVFKGISIKSLEVPLTSTSTSTRTLLLVSYVKYRRNLDLRLGPHGRRCHRHRQAGRECLYTTSFFENKQIKFEVLFSMFWTNSVYEYSLYLSKYCTHTVWNSNINTRINWNLIIDNFD